MFKGIWRVQIAWLLRWAALCLEEGCWSICWGLIGRRTHHGFGFAIVWVRVLDTKPIHLNYQGRLQKDKGVWRETKAHNDVPLMDDHVQQAVRHGSEVEIVIMMITSLLPRLTLLILLETRALKVKCVISESLSAANEIVKRKKTCFEVRKCEGCLHVFQEDKHFCLIELSFKMHHISRRKLVQFHATPKLR